LNFQLVRVDEIREAFKNAGVAESAGKRVVTWREEKGWSAARLAKEAGVAPGTVSGLETGNRIPLPKNVDKILAALGKTQFDLLRDDDETASIKRSDPLVAGLRLEDFQIARLWSRAALDVKNSVKRMLEADRERALQELFMKPGQGFADRRTGVDRRRDEGDATLDDVSQTLMDTFQLKISGKHRDSFLRVIALIRSRPEVLADIEEFLLAWEQAEEPPENPKT
jgi:transcriptional regulator with XRE-family HTH domain